MRLSGPQGRSGRAKNLAPPGFDPRTIQPVVSHCTDWATRPTTERRPSTKWPNMQVIRDHVTVQKPAMSTSTTLCKLKQSRYRPGVAQRVPGSIGSKISWQRHRKVVRLSALRTGHIYSFLLEAESTQGHSAIGRIMSMKNSSDTIWDRTSDLPICSTAS